MTRVALALPAILLMAGLLRFHGLGWGTDPETGQCHAFHDCQPGHHPSHCPKKGIDTAFISMETIDKAACL
jgi:hypothetical protein